MNASWTFLRGPRLRAIWAFLVLANAIALYFQWAKGAWFYHSDGSLYAHDFISYWAVGKRAFAGAATAIYNGPDQIAYQTALIQSPKPVVYNFFYPPHFLFVALPFALLGLVPAYIVFLSITACLYALALWLVARDWREAVLAALAGGGAYVCVLWVQNGFLTGALLVGGLALLPTRPRLAGILFGVLTIKPQLGILVPFALAAGGYWRTFGWAAGTFLGLAVAAELAFGPGIWTAFIASASNTTGFLEAGSIWFKMQTPFGLTLRILGPMGAYAVQVVVAVLAAWVALKLWRRPEVSHWLKCAALIAASLLISPYLFSYDSVPLTGAALMLLRANPELPLGDRVALIAACVLSGFQYYLFSAAVPIAAMTMLVLVLREVERGRACETTVTALA